MSTKSALRSQLRARRRALALSPEGALRSRLLQERLLESPLWRDCRRVLAYVAVKDEAGTALLISEAHRTGRALYLPRCRRQGEEGWPGTMDFLLCEAGTPLIPSPFGIPEPPLCSVTPCASAHSPCVSTLSAPESPALPRPAPACPSSLPLSGASPLASPAPSSSAAASASPAPALSPAELSAPDTLLIVPALAFDRHGFRLGYGGGYYDRVLARAACPSVGLAFHALLVPQLPRDPWDKAVCAVCTEEILLCL